MSYSTRNAKEVVVESDQLEVLVDGKVIGLVKPSESGIAWHSILNLEGHQLAMTIIQGHGDTPEAAIHKAFINGFREARNQTIAVRKLAKRLKLESLEDHDQ